MQKIFYKVEWVAFEEFARRHKEVAVLYKGLR
jgi:hypothetical protein